MITSGLNQFILSRKEIFGKAVNREIQRHGSEDQRDMKTCSTGGAQGSQVGAEGNLREHEGSKERV